MFKNPGPDGPTPLFPSTLRFVLDVLYRTRSGPSAPKQVTTRNFKNPPPGHQCVVAKP